MISGFAPDGLTDDIATYDIQYLKEFEGVPLVFTQTLDIC
jgi:hypothetical protein